jgi:hypothetical protein
VDTGVVAAGVEGLETDVVAAIDGAVDTGVVTVALGAVDDGEGDIEVGVAVELHPAANKTLKSGRAIKMIVRFIEFTLSIIIYDFPEISATSAFIAYQLFSIFRLRENIICSIFSGNATRG